MDNNELMMIVLAFVVGYMCSGMMKSMCGGRLIEGSESCPSGATLSRDPFGRRGEYRCICNDQTKKYNPFSERCV
jgi:hypothetical protein